MIGRPTMLVLSNPRSSVGRSSISTRAVSARCSAVSLRYSLPPMRPKYRRSMPSVGDPSDFGRI